MVAESRELVKQFFDGEDARRRRDLVLIWGLVVVVDAALLVAFLQGMAVDAMWRILGPGLVVAVVLGYLLSMASWRRKKTLEQRLERMLDAIELTWDDIDDMQLTPDQRGLLLDSFEAKSLATPRPNEAYRRTRGHDERGPAFGEKTNQFAAQKERTDPAEHQGDYEGLEGPLKVGETLIEEANQSYASMAQERWEAAERADMDLVEAGVERLGDLVTTDWFEKNAKDGSIYDLGGSDDVL